MSTSFEDLAQASGLSESELRLELAVWLYHHNRLPLAQSSHLAGIPLFDFMQELAGRTISGQVDAQGGKAAFEAPAEPGSVDDAGTLRLAIRHAIEIADAKTARTLIAEGRERFPDDEWIARAERVMAVPTAREVPARADRNPRADLAWLDAHADEYREQWVALSNGTLVAAAPSIERLAAEGPNLKSCFVTRVYG
jgi:hypothetical protein